MAIDAWPLDDEEFHGEADDDEEGTKCAAERRFVKSMTICCGADSSFFSNILGIFIWLRFSILLIWCTEGRFCNSSWFEDNHRVLDSKLFSFKFLSESCSSKRWLDEAYIRSRSLINSTLSMLPSNFSKFLSFSSIISHASSSSKSPSTCKSKILFLREFFLKQNERNLNQL